MSFHRGSQDLLLAIPFVAQVLVAGLCSYVVQFSSILIFLSQEHYFCLC